MAPAHGKLAASLGVLLLVALTQAASGLPRRQSLSPSGPDAYILSQGENSFSTSCSVDALLAVKERLSGGAFLWVRRSGKIYLIRDDRTLDEARALFAPLRELDPEHQALARRQKRLGAEQEPLEREQEKIEQELDRLSDDEEKGERTTAARRDLERRQRDLEPRLRALETREQELDAVELEIDEREDALEKKIEAKLWRLIDESIARGVARPDENR
jgi:bla regulator protein blaR1